MEVAGPLGTPLGLAQRDSRIQDLSLYPILPPSSLSLFRDGISLVILMVATMKNSIIERSR